MNIDYFIEKLEDGYILTINGNRYACESYDEVKNKIYNGYRQYLQKISYTSIKTMKLTLQITESI